jgi:hypothetical protein
MFPLLVLGVFIWLLIRYPANLYSPDQYTSEVGIETYAEVLNRQVRAASQVYSEATIDTLASAAKGDLSNPEASIRWSEDELTRRIEEYVEHSSITVDRSRFLAGAEPVQIPVTADTTVGDLLDAIYFELSPAVYPFTYGSSWLLMDEHGVMLTEMGTRWAGNSRDERMLKEAGIVKGSRLQVIRPPHPHPTHRN